MTQNHPLKIGIVCGEHSGDRLGAELITELQKTHDVNFRNQYYGLNRSTY